MSKKPAPITINLFPKDPFFKTIFGKSIQWALSVGRYIVIFTELLVILSFVARFTLDRKVTDLNKAIEQKKNLILSYGDLESNFRNLQFKIADYQELSVQDNIIEIFPRLTKIIPQNVILEEMQIKQGSIRLKGEVFSQMVLNTLVNNITLSPDFNDVVIDKIESLDKTRPGFAFSLHASTGQQMEVQKRVQEK